jgi:hypothetical protein
MHRKMPLQFCTPQMQNLIHSQKYHKETHYSVKFCALIKNICFKMKKHTHLNKCTMSVMGTEMTAVITRTRTEDAQEI